MTESEACEIDNACALEHVSLAKQGRRRHFANEPVVRLHGPTLPVVAKPDKRISSHHCLGYGHNYY